MPFNPTTPGVFREDRFDRAPVALPTGVPAFVGFGEMAGGLEVVQRLDQFAQRWAAPLTGSSFLGAAVAGFFANGGVRCFVVAVGEPERVATGAPPNLDALIRVLMPDGSPSPASTANPARAVALNHLGQDLAALTEVDLLAVPDAMTAFDPTTPLVDDDKETNPTISVTVASVRAVQRAVLAHCERNEGRFAILDAPPRVSNPITVLVQWRDAIAQDRKSANGALYFPWILPLGASPGQPVPPCGHVAGIVARSDARVGVFKAPANEEVLQAVDLHFPVGAAGQAQLNPAGINCLRPLTGRGLRVYGARTLSLDAEWRYVNVRRLFLTVARWIDQNMTWAAFEPNSGRLWVRIRRELSVYLEQLWRAGGLQGATTTEAFFVKCDAETNGPELRDRGQVVTEVGLAPTLPAEFIVVRITQRAGTTRLN
jgi:hypothetical protein